MLSVIRRCWRIRAAHHQGRALSGGGSLLAIRLRAVPFVSLPLHKAGQEENEEDDEGDMPVGVPCDGEVKLPD